ncbi:MAG TPA: SAM-dependent methyltransferase, partial [Pyrinomonadaceae bacterium]|nr:SAM-dependent methyltransferase [Pyrinomonadaceae bacterium]
DLATIDVAFISATKILPAIVPLLAEQGKIITLIKPQFEVGKGEVGKGGIVKDPAKHQRVVAEVNSAARTLGLLVPGIIESPIHGADGNAEFLALYEFRQFSNHKVTKTPS